MLQTIKAIAIDDEPLALRVIENHASKIPYLDLVKTTTKVMDMLLLVQKEPVDLIFLDVLMPDLTGIQFIKLIQGKQKVIITTWWITYSNQFLLKDF
ncbi:MAG: response regulator [Chitinophagaceae bacterium]